MAMINRKDTPAPTLQRANPPPTLDLKGAPTDASSYRDSPPLTPPYRVRTKSGRAFKAQNDQPTPRETYRDGLTEGNQNNARGAGGNEPPPNQRISHDLSLALNPRHSVVDNMLMSLNPDQPRYVSPPSTQRPSYSAGSQFSSFKSVRHRGHLHSSSSTSDTVKSVDESPSRFSTQFSRGRRSNSSSNFPPPLGRIDSGRHREEADPTKRANAPSRQRAGTLDRSSVPGSRAGRQSSKSSGSSSVDFGSMMAATKWQNPLGRRSSSFDHDHRRQLSSLGSNPPSTMPTNRPQPTASHGPETAVPPIVPIGPRSRDQSPSKQPRAPTTERRGSNASTKANKLKKSKGDGIEGVGKRTGRSTSPEKRQGSQQPPPPRSTGNPRSASIPPASRAQSPTRPCHESPLRQGSVSQASGTPRERPGFFRRVFGSSSKNANNMQHDLRHPQLHSSRNSVRADSRTGFSTPQALHLAEVPSQAAHPVLVKKPSSFFRRRKKSVSEPIMTPMPQEQPPSQLRSMDRPNDAMPEPSPVSSLRQVMDPFLHHPVTPRRNSSKGQEGSLATINTPSGRASTKPPWTRQKSLQDLSRARQGHPSGPTSVPRESPDASGIVKSDDDSLQPPATSFLHDNSSSEEKSSQPRHEVPPWDPEPDNMALKRAVKTFPLDAACHKENDPRLKSPKTFPQERPPKPTNASSALSPRTLNATVNQQHNVTPKKPGTQDWLTAAHISPAEEKPLPPEPSDSAERMWLQPDQANDDIPRSYDTSPPNETMEVSPISAYETASSSPNKPKPEFTPVATSQFVESVTIDPEVTIDHFEPTSGERETAAKVFHGDESVVLKSKAAAWLGDEGPERARLRRAFMDLFAWQDRNILAALRDFCSRLLLKGETQQVDRLLDALSSRWCTCNPNHGFKAIGKIVFNPPMNVVNF